MYEIPPLPPEEKPLLSRTGIFLKKHHEIIAIIINSIIALSAIIALLVAWDSANAANKSAETASRTVTVSQDSAKKQLRAYLGFETVRIEDGSLTHSSKDVFYAKIKNYGQTPAHEISFWATFYQITKRKNGDDFELPSNFTYPEPVAEGNMVPVGYIYLNPSEDTESWNSVTDPSIQVFKEDYNREFSTYIYGELKYTDIYNVVHIRSLCFYVFPRPGLPLEMLFTKTHNGESDIK